MRFIIIITIFSMFLACSDTDSSSSTTVAETTQTSDSTPSDKSNLKGVAKSNPNAILGRNPNAESPDINIKINGAQPGLVRVIGFFTGEQYRADSVMTDASGAINIKAPEAWRSGLYYVSYPGDVAFQMIVADDQRFSMVASANDVNGTMKITGSEENELLYKTIQFEGNWRSKYEATRAQTTESERDKLLAERKAYMDNLFASHGNTFYAKFKEAGQNPTVRDIKLPNGAPDKDAQIWHYRRDFWDNVDFNDLRLLNTPVITNKLKKYIDDLTAQRPDSIIASAKFLVDKVLDYPEYYQYFANWITLHYEPLETSLMDPQAVYVHMIENYFTYNRAFWSDSVEIFSLQQRAYEMTSSLVGKQGPNLTVPSVDGGVKTLYDIKAPYIIVYMYNPECEHCAVETPKLVQFNNQWKSQGVEVYAIAVDTEDDKWRDYIKKTGMQGFTNVFDPTNQSIYAKYFVDHTPELYLLNPDRIIIGKNLKVDQVAEMINRDKNR